MPEVAVNHERGSRYDSSALSGDEGEIIKILIRIGAYNNKRTII